MLEPQQNAVRTVMSKKLLLFLSMLLTVSASARTVPRDETQRRISSVVSKVRHRSGVESVSLGAFGTAAVRGIAKVACASDPEISKVLRALNGIRRIEVLQYEDCAPKERERIARELEAAFEGCELLLEASDGGDSVRIFGYVDEESGKIRDFVLHAPGESSLVCLFGTLSIDVIGKLAAVR